MSNNTGGPAFPCETLGIDDHGEYRKPYEGMTLRDYFAGKALQGLLANPKLEKQIIEKGQRWIEDSAWAFADEMIKKKELYYK